MELLKISRDFLFLTKREIMRTQRVNGSLYSKIENYIATVEFGHPSANCFPLELLERLEKEFIKLSDNNEVRLIILKSEGEKTFCAGASFDELLSLKNEEESIRFFSGFAKLFLAMRDCKQPIIGRVLGKTVGGGVGLLSACDYVMATESASIKLSELSIGIGPFVIAPVVSRKMGVAAFNELTLSPDQWKNAYWAQEKGLFARVFENIEEMDKALEYFAETLVKSNPEALSEMKRITWENTEHWDKELMEKAAISGRLALSEQTQKTLSKIKNK